MEYLGRLPRAGLVALGVFLVTMIGLVDYLTGPHASLLFLYLLPVMLASSYGGRRVGQAIAIISAGVWSAVAFAERSSQLHAAHHLWNGAANLAVFLTIAAMVSAVAASRRRQDELLQFIVHDLRSPMTNIQSGLQTLQEMSEGKLEDTDQELIAMALVSSDRVLTLVNSLLDLPRIESGKLPLHLEAIPTEELVATALDQVGMWARQNQVDLKADGDGAPPAVMADRVVTGRVLVNLLSNALKYSPPMSTITLRARASDDGHVVLSVEDHGPGIPPEWVDKVFDPFTQVASRKSGAATGTGLGLTFCQKAVQAQGGRIWLKSKLGHGTTVSVALPKAA